jgi:hypothetical protein
VRGSQCAYRRQLPSPWSRQNDRTTCFYIPGFRRQLPEPGLWLAVLPLHTLGGSTITLQKDNRSMGRSHKIYPSVTAKDGYGLPGDAVSWTHGPKYWPGWFTTVELEIAHPVAAD